MSYYQLTLDEIATLTNTKRPKKQNRKSKFWKKQQTRLQQQKVANDWFL